MQYIYYFIIFPLIQNGHAVKETAPVFLMDHEGAMAHLIVEPNPFHKIDVSIFASICHEAKKNAEIIIIFIEETFCSEDVSTRDKLGSPYLHLHQGLKDKKVKFFPAIMQPYRTLHEIFHPQQFNVFYLGSTSTKLNLFDNRYKHYYVYFQDRSNETRQEALRRHDLIMQEVYFIIRQLTSGPIVAFYTGKSNPIVVEKIQFVPLTSAKTPREASVMIVTDGALFQFEGVYSSIGTRRATFDQIPRVADQSRTRRKLSTTMTYGDFELQFNFGFKRDGWLLDNVALLEGGEEVGRTDMGVGAPWTWSYVCGEPLVVINSRDGSSVIISKYQIEAFQRRESDNGTDSNDGNTTASGSDNGTNSFGQTINCGPYFSAHILSGLFVAFVCLSVLLYGVGMLFNCHANDRYDDPISKR